MRWAEDEAGTDIPSAIQFGIFDEDGDLCALATVTVEHARVLLRELATILDEAAQ